MSGLSVAKSMGHHGHWGFSAGFDILSGLNNINSNSDSELEPENILLIQPGDIRHILYTISRRRRYGKNKLDQLRPIHFYLFETPVEVLARNLLLLELINDYEVPIRQRANIFLEIFGNNKVQKRTAAYIEQLGSQLRLLLTKGRGQLDNVVDFSLLKYRERDELEEAFKKFSRACPFDMNNLYDHRQRGLYEERFDSRKALVDWDYHSTLKAKASIVHIKQYKEWRHSGIAFEFGDQTYSEPNRTLMSYAEGVMKKGKERGIKKEVKGFWGDIINSPYLSFGTDSETPNKHAEGLYEIYNKNTGTEQHRHHSVEVALYNLFCVLWESETGQQYRMTKAHDIYSGLGAEASYLSSKLDSPTEQPAEQNIDESAEKESEPVADESLLPVVEGAEGEEEEEKEEVVEEVRVDIDLTEPDKPPEVSSVSDLPSPPEKSSASSAETRSKEIARAIVRAETIEETYRGVKVFPITGTPAAVLDKPKYKHFFDCVFVSSRAAQVMGEPFFGTLLKQDGRAYAAVESAKFIVPLSQDLKAELAKRETEMAQKLNWKPIPAPVPRRRRDELDLEDDVLFFQPQR